MKLVDAEITQETEGPSDIARAPRPARRRVYISLFVTLSVLVGTVAVVFTVFSNRQDEVVMLAMQAHQEPPKSEIEELTGIQIRAWSLGVFGESAPWPEVDEKLVAKSASALRVFKRDMAIVRYELNGKPLTVAMLRKRDPMPRTLHRSKGGLYAVSWGRKRFNTIAVGAEATKAEWTAYLQAP